jgi:hypothetical protein
MRCEYAVLVLVLVLMLMVLLPDQTLGLCFGADHILGCESLYVRIHEMDRTWVCTYCTVYAGVNSYGITGRGSDLFHTFTHHDFYVHVFLLSNITHRLTFDSWHLAAHDRKVKEEEGKKHFR